MSKLDTLQDMFNAVDIMVCRLSGFPPINKLLKEYPDGSRKLDECFSPFLPKEAYLTPENEYDFTDDNLELENMKNFQWGITDNIIPALKACVTNYGADINKDYFRILDEISETLNKKILLAEGELNEDKEYIKDELMHNVIAIEVDDYELD